MPHIRTNCLFQVIRNAMETKSLLSVNFIFSLLCVLGTVGLGIECLRKFIADEDISLNDYVKYHYEDYEKNIYPSFSFCIVNPFLDQNLRKYGNDINVTSYSYFLQGLFWDDRMLKIDYDNVTVSIEDSLVSVLMRLNGRGPDGKRIEKSYHQKEYYSGKFKWKPNFYVSFRSSIRKCFTFDIPTIKQQSVYHYIIRIKNSIFPSGKRPTGKKFDGSNPNEGGTFSVYFHYPGQRFTSYHTNRDNWDALANDSNPYIMLFVIDDVEVIRFRNKRKRTCIENWMGFDKIIMNDIISSAKCHPPHWNANGTVSQCSTKEQMKHFKDQPKIGDVEKYDHPCNMVKMLKYSYREKMDHGNEKKYTILPGKSTKSTIV